MTGPAADLGYFAELQSQTGDLAFLDAVGMLTEALSHVQARRLDRVSDPSTAASHLAELVSGIAELNPLASIAFAQHVSGYLRVLPTRHGPAGDAGVIAGDVHRGHLLLDVEPEQLSVRTGAGVAAGDLVVDGVVPRVLVPELYDRLVFVAAGDDGGTLLLSLPTYRRGVEVVRAGDDDGGDIGVTAVRIHDALVYAEDVAEWPPDVPATRWSDQIRELLDLAVVRGLARRDAGAPGAARDLAGSLDSPVARLAAAIGGRSIALDGELPHDRLADVRRCTERPFQLDRLRITHTPLDPERGMSWTSSQDAAQERASNERSR